MVTTQLTEEQMRVLEESVPFFGEELTAMIFAVAQEKHEKKAKEKKVGIK